MYMRFNTSIWNKLKYQTPRAPFNAYTNKLDKIAVMQAT